MNKFVFGAALAALSLGVPAAAPAQRAAGAVVVVVDTGRIYRECTACVAAQGQLQSQVNAMQQRAQQLRQPLQTEAQSIEQAAQAARNQQGAARTATETSLQQRVQALQTRENTANQELSRLDQNIRSTQAHVVQQINTRLNPIISQVMTARGANLAVDVAATLAHTPALDVTNDVLARLNQQLPSVSVTPLPQQPAQQQPTGR
ncbi:MAG TPA: OmpH family outer membrane protein [Allosphingosinicella sp.]|nr:OmpH family outer membrane protein [Allosphingosinicella sp.]